MRNVSTAPARRFPGRKMLRHSSITRVLAVMSFRIPRYGAGTCSTLGYPCEIMPERINPHLTGEDRFCPLLSRGQLTPMSRHAPANSSPRPCNGRSFSIVRTLTRFTPSSTVTRVPRRSRRDSGGASEKGECAPHAALLLTSTVSISQPRDGNAFYYKSL
jgi:hypothetical protein